MTAAVAGPATRAAVRDAANVIRDEMRIKAPELDEKTAASTSLNPGVLRHSIRTVVHPTDRAGFVLAEIGPKRGIIHVAVWVEWGHRLVRGGYSSFKRGRLQGGGKEIGEVPAHPFLRPAFEASSQLALQEFARSLKMQLGRWFK